MGTRVVKPVVLDETMQEVVEKLGDIKDTLDAKTFTPSILLDNKPITENGVYEAVLDEDTPCDGYAKVTVNVAGGGVDFESVMLDNVPQAVVPASWEIPVTVTAIPDRNDWRDALLDNKDKLETVQLANGHTGLTALGKSAFDGFKSLSTVGFEIPVNLADRGGSLPERVFADTLILNPSFKNTVKFLHSECFSDVEGDTFSSTQITNENYRIDEASPISDLYEYEDTWGTGDKVYTERPYEHLIHFKEDKLFGYGNDIEMVYTRDGYDHDYDGGSTGQDKGLAWSGTSEPELLNEDGTPYTGTYYHFENKVDEYDHQNYFVLMKDDGHWDGIWEQQKPEEYDAYGYSETSKPELLNEDGSPYQETGKFSFKQMTDTEGTWEVIVYDGSGDRVQYNGHGGGEGTDADYGAFKECNISSYNLPNLVKVQSYMFERNYAVTEFSFPNVTRVGEHAFNECSDAATFNLPKCEYLYANAFENCNNMQLLKLTNVTAVTVLKNVWDFPQLGNPVTVQVPNALLSDFQNDSEWQQLVNDNKVVLQGV